MDKLFIRITIFVVSIYLLICYVLCLFGLDIWHQTYHILFEICVCLCISAQGRYHCKYIRWSAYGVTAADILSELDNYLDFLPVNESIFIPIILIIGGLTTTLALSINHYINVRKLKRYGQLNRQ